MSGPSGGRHGGSAGTSTSRRALVREAEVSGAFASRKRALPSNVVRSLCSSIRTLYFTVAGERCGDVLLEYLGQDEDVDRIGWLRLYDRALLLDVLHVSSKFY